MTKNSSKRGLLLNTVSSVTLQLVSLVAGFLVPRLIISTYGSETNGLVQSISQFMGLITLMQLGIGAVVQTAFYAPLYKRDSIATGEVYYATKLIFRYIALFYLGYVAIIVIVYPHFIVQTNDVIGVSVLILVLSISLLMQYYWSLTNQLLLWADRKGYVCALLQSIAILVSTSISVFLMLNSFSIQVTKLASSVSFIIPVIGMHYYVNRNYQIIKPGKIRLDAIPHRLSGTAQHLASMALNSIDIIIVTFMLGLSQASVYSVYYMIAYNIRLLVMASSNGIQSVYGRTWASGDRVSISDIHDWTKHLFGAISLLIFLPTALLIADFVSIYTSGITDVAYRHNQLGMIIVLVQFLYCIQIPQTMLIKAANMFRETQRYYYLEAIIKVASSFVFVVLFGVVGVAMGSVLALVMRNIYLRHVTKGLMLQKKSLDIMELLLYVLTIISMFTIMYSSRFLPETYLQWLGKAVVAVTVAAFVFFVLAFFLKGKAYIRTIVHRHN